MNSASVLGAAPVHEISEPVREAMAYAQHEIERAFGLLDEAEQKLSRYLAGVAPAGAAGKSVKEAPKCEAHEQAMGIAESATGLCDRLIQLRERIVV